MQKIQLFQIDNCIFFVFTNIKIMKKNILAGALLLSLGGLICKIIGAIYKIPLSNILGAEGMGIYQLSYPLYAFLLVFVSGGIPYALSSVIAKARASKNEYKIYSYFYYALIYSLILAVCFFLLLFCFSKSLAKLQGNESATFSYLAFSVTILFSCLLPCFRGLFQGFENFVPTFFSQIIEQVLKLLLGLFLSYSLMKYSLALGVLGASLGILIGEVVSFFYLLLYFIFKKKKYIVLTYKNDIIGKEFLKFSFTLTLTALVIPFINVYQSFIIIPFLQVYGLSTNMATIVYGIQTGMVNSIINFPTVLSTSLAIVLMPSISYFFESNKEKVKKLLEQSFKYIFVFATPCIIGLYIIAPYVMELVFPSLSNSLLIVGWELLRLSSFAILFIVIAQVSLTILQSIQKQWSAFLSMIIFAGVYIVLLPIFIVNFGIYGISLTIILSYAILSLINVYFIKKETKIIVKFKDLFVSLFGGIFMGFITFIFCNLFSDFNLFLRLFIAISVSALVYFFVLFLFKVITINEIKNIKQKNI